MSRVLFIGDLHIDHKAATKWRTQFESIEHHNAHIWTCWRTKVTKNDLVYVVGDVAFSTQGLELLGDLPGRKILVHGNHDELPTIRYLNFFEDVRGAVKLKYKHERYWVTHIPIHPAEMRGGYNIHGHVHEHTINDARYYNVSCENVDYTPMSIEELIRRNNERGFTIDRENERPKPNIKEGG